MSNKYGFYSGLLYHKDSKGKLRVWETWNKNDEVFVRYGLDGGKMIKTSFKCTPKNVGRANETTSSEQAEKESMALYQNKLDRKYSMNKASAMQDKFLPMLAQTFQKRQKHVDFNTGSWFSSPKMDGVRAMAFCDSNGDVQLLSRSGQEWFVPHIQEQLERVMSPGEMLDGEIYIHGKTFQEISSLVKKYRVESENLEFHVFERIMDKDNPKIFEKNKYFDIFSNPNAGPNIVMTFYQPVKSIQDLNLHHDQYVKQGYEGAMLRNVDTPYQFGSRSTNILKYKRFDDTEYKIVDVVEGKGKFLGCGIFVCETVDGKRFNVTPKCTEDKKREIWNWRQNYPGNILKVQHQSLTDDGIPRFPVGLGTRDPRDMTV